jgi:predicted RNA-binding protein with PUA-like domain
MRAFLVKSEPDAYAFDDLVRDGQTLWDGVRNFEAQKHMRSMKKGDVVLYYHTGKERAVVGIARVTGAPRPEPGADGDDWCAVDLAPLKKLVRPVTLAAIKADPGLADFALVKRARLSVMPVEKRELERVLALGGTKL